MKLYDVVLFLHISGVIVAFMLAGALHACLSAMPRVTTLGGLRPWTQVMSYSSRVIGFAILAVVLIGFWLLGIADPEDDFHVSSPWVLTALVGVVVLMGLSGAVMGRYQRDVVDGLAAALAQGSDNDPVPAELHAAIASPRGWTVAFVLTWGFAGIVFLMTVKPGWAGSVAALVVAMLLGAGEGRWLVGRQSR